MSELESMSIVWLENEYKKLRDNNPSYSLRAFAQKIDVPAGRISQFFSGKRQLTIKMGEKISDRLGYDPVKRKKFISSIELDRIQRLSFKSISQDKENKKAQELDMDQFLLMSDPIHLSILSLIELDDFKSNIHWISERLNEPSHIVQLAIQRLKRLNLIKVQNNRFVQIYQNGVTTSHDVSSVALKKSHKKILEKASQSLDDIDVEFRDLTSMTMAIDIKKLPECKALIKNFRRNLCQFLEAGEKNEVYLLNIQLFPVTNRENKKRVKKKKKFEKSKHNHKPMEIKK